MNAGTSLPAAPLDALPMSGPEFCGLIALAPPEQMTAWLDGLRTTPLRYLKLWKALMAGIGATTHSIGDRLVSGMDVEEPFLERKVRFEALTAHLAQSGPRDALLASLRTGNGGSHV